MSERTTANALPMRCLIGGESVQIAVLCTPFKGFLSKNAAFEHLPKLGVAGSNPVSRSTFRQRCRAVSRSAAFDPRAVQRLRCLCVASFLRRSR
jgi:hypothetical protein